MHILFGCVANEGLALFPVFGEIKGDSRVCADAMIYMRLAQDE